MDARVAQELLNELGSSLENLETQQAALLQFLKDKGIVRDDQLAPYLNEAGNASSVRWRATHVRLEHIFSAAAEKEQQTAKPEDHQKAGTQTPPEQDKNHEEPGKPAKSGIKPAASETTRAEEGNPEKAQTRPQAPAAEHEPSAQRREEDAA
jgi:hypothetical protein